MRMSLQCCGIIIINDTLCEIDDGSIAIRVRIAEVNRVVLGHGFQAPHPILQIGLGLVFMGLGCMAGIHLLYLITEGGDFIRLEAGLIAFGIVGVWLVGKAVNRGFYLDVYSTQGLRRLGFDDEATAEKMRTFLPALAATLRVPVTTTVPGIH